MVLSVWAALRAWLWPGLSSDEIDGATTPARLDLALDTRVRAASQEQASRWIDREIFADGSHREATSWWATRAKKTRTVVGDDSVSDDGETRCGGMVGVAGRGLTLYLGSRGSLEVCVYEKDRHRSDSSDTLRETLFTAGDYDPATDRLIRAEYRLGATWWRDQQVAAPGGRLRRGSEMTIVDALAAAPALCIEVLDRTRQTDRMQTDRRRDRRDDSAWHGAMRAAAARWRDEEGSVTVCVSKKREASIQRSESAALGAAARIAGARGITMGDALKSLVTVWESMETLPARLELLRNKGPLELGLSGEQWRREVERCSREIARLERIERIMWRTSQRLDPSCWEDQLRDLRTARTAEQLAHAAASLADSAEAIREACGVDLAPTVRAEWSARERQVSWEGAA